MRLPGMDEPTDLPPVPQRTDDERRAAAGLLDAARTPWRGGADGRAGVVVTGGGPAGDGPDLIAEVERRAARQHRRRLAGAGVAAVAVAAALALVVPAVVPGGGGGIVAAPGLDRGSAAPAPGPSASDLQTSPEDRWPPTAVAAARDALVLTDAQVEAFVTGVQGEPPGTLGIDNARHLRDTVLVGSLTTGGWCRQESLVTQSTATRVDTGETEMITVEPSGMWSATWRAGAAARPGVAVDEKAVTWSSGKVFPSDAESARSYVEATGASSTTCDGTADRGLAGAFRVLPAPLAGAVQAAAPVEGRPGTWQVRSVASAEGSGTAVDLTVVLPAPSAQEAGRTVVPLLRRALERVTAWDTVLDRSDRAGTQPQAGPTSTAPGRVLVRPYQDFAASLTLEQVDAVLPGVVLGAPVEPATWGLERTGPCAGPLDDPDNFAEAVDGGNVAGTFEARRDGGAVSVQEWVGNEERALSVVRLAVPPVPGPACGPTPAGTTWQPEVLSRAGTDLAVVVRHPDGDPQRWVVRGAAAVDPSWFVGLEVEITADSQADVAAVVVPLLAAARQRAYDANFVPSTP